MSGLALPPPASRPWWFIYMSYVHLGTWPDTAPLASALDSTAGGRGPWHRSVRHLRGEGHRSSATTFLPGQKLLPRSPTKE